MFNIGDKVRILTPFAELMLGSDRGVVTLVKEKSCVVQVEDRGNKLVYKFHEIEKLCNN